MKKGVYLKQFVAGFFIPAVMLILLLVVLSFFDLEEFFMSWDLLFSPIFLGFYNIVYFKVRQLYPFKNQTIRYGVHGLILFAILSLSYTIIDLNFNIHPGQEKLLGSTLNFWWHITPILYWPLIAYFLFAYLQKPFNHILGLKI